MKIKAGQAIFAILDVVIEMSAKQKAFHEVILSSLSNDSEELKSILADLDKQSVRNIDLMRAKLAQYSEFDMNDLLNGEIDF